MEYCRHGFLHHIPNPPCNLNVRPGVLQVMANFNSDSTVLATFVVSVYILGFAPTTIGSGTIASIMQIVDEAWRFGPWVRCFGPIVGGYLVQGTNWRWMFWVLAIVVSLYLLWTLEILVSSSGAYV